MNEGQSYPPYEPEDINANISEPRVLYVMKHKGVSNKYFQYFKEETKISDDILASWFDMSVKTFRNYKNKDMPLKEHVQEQLILLISLFKHGEMVFGEIDLFSQWLDKDNFFLDGDKPISYLNTVTGIRYIDERLTAMEYGDNV